MKRIILADNQDITRLGWLYLINQVDSSIEIIVVVEKKDLLAYLSQQEQSLVIFDYTLFDFESANELIILQSRFSKTDWILFSEELSDDFLRTLLLNSNSISVLLKNNSIDEIRTGFREALRGNRYICNHVSNILLDSSKKYESKQPRQVLTSTEQDILKEMALGKTTKEIAALRYVSVHTIMTHRKNIFRKIEVNNIHEATKYAMRAGIVDMAEYYI